MLSTERSFIILRSTRRGLSHFFNGNNYANSSGEKNKTKTKESKMKLFSGVHIFWQYAKEIDRSLISSSRSSHSNLKIPSNCLMIHLFFFLRTCPHSNLIYIHNFTSDINECLINKGGCSHNCINLDGTYICSCPTGNELDSTRKNCVGKISLYFTFLLRRTLNVHWSEIVQDSHRGVDWTKPGIQLAPPQLL